MPEGIPTEVMEHRLFEEKRICDAYDTVIKEIGKAVCRNLKPALDSEGCMLYLRCKQREVETSEEYL